MNIVEFYKDLSRILEFYREKSITYGDAKFRLSELVEKAKLSNLDVNISDNILDMDNLIRYDDEMSYEEPFEPSIEIEEDQSY